MKLLHITLIICIFLSISPSAHAHKVRVFAYESGGEIFTEVKFNSGRPAQKSAVSVQKKGGTVLLTGLTDETGTFRFTPPAEAVSQELELFIIADLGEGHRGQWKMAASDYLGIEEKIEEETNPAQSISESSSSPPTFFAECRDIENRISQIIENELKPIKRSLSENKTRKVTLQDILGGLGYIFGLAGIAAYYHAKKSGDTR